MNKPLCRAGAVLLIVLLLSSFSSIGIGKSEMETGARISRRIDPGRQGYSGERKAHNRVYR
ncbi:MAG: hypothetical protein PUC76_02860 [Clostridia bacterium]|nr:hypothetical protein [Clostridia bacterium]